MELSEALIQQKRTPDELTKFVNEAFDSISSNESIKKQARMRVGLFKVLIEEVYPFSAFCINKYKDTDVMCYTVVGNQGYDAIIETEDGHLKEVIELTWPIDGQKEHFQNRKLNDQGHTDIEVWDFHDNKNRIKIIERIVAVAKKKALKNYDRPEGSSLIFVLDIAPYFGMQEIECWDEIKILIEQMKAIDFLAKSVYVLFMPCQELLKVKGS